MTQPEWRRLDEYFAQAVELEGDARAGFVRGLAAADPAMARELESLLAAHGESEAAFQQPIVPQVAPRTSAGEWRLKEILGEGGLGVVRRAERSRGGQTEVGAVKYVHAGYDSGAFRARFLKERTILRTLEHPAIARLLDGGMDEEGRPFLVMEYVDGRGWNEYMAEAAPPLETRARLFGDLLDAVSYLHGRNVVHGDIKPSNVMITAAGKVKLLDFGAARMLDLDGRPRDSTFTRAMVTPGWASPEQMSGGACTAKSDVYSLGLLLRLSLEGTAGDADLAAIAEQAAREEPDERYDSAEAMGADIGRYLRRRPVGARSGNRWYRLRKFGRRNRAAIGLAACLALACGGGFWMWWAQRVKARQLNAPVQKASGANQALASVAGPVAAAKAPASSTDQIDMQLSLAYTSLTSGNCGDVDKPLAAVARAMPKMPAGRAKDIARMRYLLLRGLCDAKTNGKPEAADAIDEGFQLREKLGAPDTFKPSFAPRLSQLGRSYMDSGEMARGAKLTRWAAVEAFRAGRAPEAVQMWTRLLTRLKREESRDLLVQFCGLAPPGVASRGAVANACSATPVAVGEPNEAENAEAGLEQTPNSVDALSRAVAAHLAMANARQSERKPAEARKHMKRRLELLERLVQLEPGNERWRIMQRRSQARFTKSGQ